MKLALAAISTPLLAPLVALASAARPDRLRLRLLKPNSDYVTGPILEVTKAGQRCTIQCECIADLIYGDIYGMDAGRELTDIICQELEYDVAAVLAAYGSKTHSTGSLTDDIFAGQQRRCVVTKTERIQLYLAITDLRKRHQPRMVGTI